MTSNSITVFVVFGRYCLSLSAIISIIKRDNQLSARDAPFKVGDKVLKAQKAIVGRQKLIDKWETTPYTVTKKMSHQDVYVIQDVAGKEKTVHRNLLTACTFSETEDDVEDFANIEQDDTAISRRRSERDNRSPKRYGDEPQPQT